MAISTEIRDAEIVVIKITRYDLETIERFIEAQQQKGAFDRLTLLELATRASLEITEAAVLLDTLREMGVLLAGVICSERKLIDLARYNGLRAIPPSTGQGRLAPAVSATPQTHHQPISDPVITLDQNGDLAQRERAPAPAASATPQTHHQPVDDPVITLDQNEGLAQRERAPAVSATPQTHHQPVDDPVITLDQNEDLAQRERAPAASATPQTYHRSVDDPVITLDQNEDLAQRERAPAASPAPQTHHRSVEDPVTTLDQNEDLAQRERAPAARATPQTHHRSVEDPVITLDQNEGLAQRERAPADSATPQRHHRSVDDPAITLDQNEGLTQRERAPADSATPQRHHRSVDDPVITLDQNEDLAQRERTPTPAAALDQGSEPPLSLRKEAPPSSPQEAAAPLHTIVVRHPVLSGQRVKNEHGDIVVLARVEKGAVIAAAGDVVTHASCEGMLLAGVNGNENASIYTNQLLAEAVSISNYYARSQQYQNVRKDLPLRISLQEQRILFTGLSHPLPRPPGQKRAPPLNQP